MPAAAASCRPTARSDTGLRSTTARSVTVNLPPSSAAMRSICAVSTDTELSRSVSTAASETGSCSPAGATSAIGRDLQCLLAHQGVDQFSHVQRIAGGLGRQPS